MAIEALQVSDGYKGPIDLLLTDMVMPGMGGRTPRDGIDETPPRSPTGLYVRIHRDRLSARRDRLTRAACSC